MPADEAAAIGVGPRHDARADARAMVLAICDRTWDQPDPGSSTAHLSRGESKRLGGLAPTEPWYPTCGLGLAQPQKALCACPLASGDPEFLIRAITLMRDEPGWASL